jgi:hypothetical protein
MVKRARHKEIGKEYIGQKSRKICTICGREKGKGHDTFCKIKRGAKRIPKIKPP